MFELKAEIPLWKVVRDSKQHRTGSNQSELDLVALSWESRSRYGVLEEIRILSYDL